MCTCNQNARSSCFSNSGCGWTRNCYGQNGCRQNGCGYQTGNTTDTVTGNGGNGCGTFGYCNRYMSFRVMGTAYVPTNAIYFCPDPLGTVGQTNGTGNTNTTGTGNCGNGCGCGCFGRCGGARAISNYYEDYYARQYGLND